MRSCLVDGFTRARKHVYSGACVQQDMEMVPLEAAALLSQYTMLVL